jgi:hypothetical protein
MSNTSEARTTKAIDRTAGKTHLPGRLERTEWNEVRRSPPFPGYASAGFRPIRGNNPIYRAMFLVMILESKPSSDRKTVVLAWR